MLITDAQVHLWEVDRPDRPWPQPARNQPHRPAGFSAEQALEAMDEAGVDRAVIVPPTWVGENNATGLEAAAKYPARFAVMGRFDVTTPDAEQHIAHWLDQPGMLGIRMTFTFTPRPEQLNDGSLEWYWTACERAHIPLMMQAGGMVERIGPIAQRHPDLRIILDHMGLGRGRGPAVFSDLDMLLILSALPNVYVKMTAVPVYSAEAYPHRDIQPYLRRIYDSFGPTRLFWGSDVTRLEGSYRDCVRLFQEDLDFLSAEDREWVLGKALAQALDWPESAD